MLTKTRPMNVFAANATLAVFGGTDKVVWAPCSGMSRFVGEFAYDGAPAAPPTIEFSMNGQTSGYLQAAPVGANPAPGITLYTWDIQINSWAFVKLTIPKPGTSVSGAAKLVPKIQN